MPATLGYITAMLYNQNNCASEGGAVTGRYEVEVGAQLCEMIGYNPQTSMGHLVAGGSIANVEAIWAARNVKFFPLGLQEAIIKEPKLAAAQLYKVFLPELSRDVPLVDATQWQLLNLDTDAIINMPEEVAKMACVQYAELMEIMDNFAYESIGAQAFCRRHNLETMPCFIASSAAHLSLVKAATILGIGKANLVCVPLDEHARMDIKGSDFFCVCLFVCFCNSALYVGLLRLSIAALQTSLQVATQLLGTELT